MWHLFRRKHRKSVSPEEQLAVLSSCGIRLAAGVQADALTASLDCAAYETKPYLLALTVLGGEAEVGATAGKYLSDQIWHFDTECIEDHGAYAAIAARLRTLSQGDLPLEDIKDYVDIEEGRAWVSFRLVGEAHRWEAAVDDDWVDPKILSRFAELLTQRGCGRRFTYIDLGGQDCLIGCATPEERAALGKRTGLKVEWLM